jgi:hypothetical protein
MRHVTLADVVLRRVPLTAREAVTLTLAVAREWDRQQALHGPVLLPELQAIQLQDTGDVAFLVTEGPPSAQPATLSSLLGRLLGTDETESPQHLQPRGVVTVPDDSFRSVLTRFADEDYSKVVASIFERTVSVCREQTVELSSDRVARYGGPERRRQPRIVSELRLDIRQLERELFSLRTTAEPAVAMPTKSKFIPTVRLALTCAGVCAVALLADVAVEWNLVKVAFTTRAPSKVADAVESEPAQASSSPIIEPVATIVPERLDSTADVRLQSIPSTPQRAVKSARRPTVRQRRLPSSPAASRPPQPVTFAGGTRNITWLNR